MSKEQNKLTNAIIYFVQETNKCQITKLMKLLYLLDFLHFRQAGRSVTGLDYYAWPQSPVPRDLWSDLKNIQNAPAVLKDAIAVIQSHDENNIKIKSKKKFDEAVFTPRELALLKGIAFKFKELDATKISNYSHTKDAPWDKTVKIKGPKQKIDYFYSLELEDSAPALSKDEIIERQVELDQIKKFLEQV